MAQHTGGEVVTDPLEVDRELDVTEQAQVATFLQEFLPAQPLSPPLQPPMPLHSFLPPQSCLATVAQPP